IFSTDLPDLPLNPSRKASSMESEFLPREGEQERAMTCGWLSIFTYYHKKFLEKLKAGHGFPSCPAFGCGVKISLAPSLSPPLPRRWCLPDRGASPGGRSPTRKRSPCRLGKETYCPPLDIINQTTPHCQWQRNLSDIFEQSADEIGDRGCDYA